MLTLPALNLWNFPNWRYDMSGGMEESYKEFEAHYKVVAPEPISVIEEWDLNFNLGNAVKYIARCRYKGQKDTDLKKAIYYLQRELENAHAR
jgi:hypothetical protein